MPLLRAKQFDNDVQETYWTNLCLCSNITYSFVVVDSLISHLSAVNPGGWAPPSVVRAVSKREYPKFLRKISSFCQNACKDKPITM